MKKLSVFIALISLTIIFIFSCQKDKTYQAGESNNLKTTVTGIVLSENNAPLTGVTVAAYGQTTTTNLYGTFVFENLNVNKDRCVLKFTKAGFFNRSHGFIAAGNTVNYVRIILVKNTSTQNFSSSAGGTIYLPGGSSAEFQPNSFVTSNGSAYTGTVHLVVKHLSPDDANFGFMIPGGDLLGKDLNNKDVALYTYGMLGVELTGSSGEVLQLANGTTATLTLSIAASQLASASATIPLWFFDETTSLWKEEGVATKVGNRYVGTVKHFSWWNWDLPGNWAGITGRVIDCQNIPMPNVLVTLVASNGYSTFAPTNQNGDYHCMVAAGFSTTVQVLASNNPYLTQNSQLENVPALTTNQIYTVPDFMVQCLTRVAGTVKNCAGENISAYVAISDGSSNFFDYQYTTSGFFSMGTIPNAQLDLSASSFGTYHYLPVTSLSPPLVLNVGNILLCDSVLSTANNVTLNGGPFSNQLFNITPDLAEGSAGGFETDILLSGISYPYTIAFGEFAAYGSVPGTYASGMMNFTMHNLLNQNDSWYIDYFTGGTFTLTQVDPVGGRIKGTFILPCSIDDNMMNYYPGTVTINFDVLRTQ